MLKTIWELFFPPSYIHYDGYNCGCCGQWVKASFSIRKRDSKGEWWDTWGICETCVRSAYHPPMEEENA